MTADIALIAGTPHMWFALGMVVFGLLLYASEKLPVEVASLILLSTLLIFFFVFPLTDADGTTRIDTGTLLDGFSNPALITVLSLMIIGQAVIRTGALNGVASAVLTLTRGHKHLSIISILLLVCVMSAVINDTPVCVMFIPIMSLLARRLHLSASKVMMPLSFACIFGGTTTLIGSSTNLLVSGAVTNMGLPPLGMFDFTIPGLVLAAAGLFYVIFIIPFLLPERAPLASEMADKDRQFIAQLEVAKTSPLVGKALLEGNLFDVPDVTLKIIQRGERSYLPPFNHDLTIEGGDMLVVTATREGITALLKQFPQSMHSFLGQESQEPEKKENAQASLVEVLIAPTSRMVGQTIEQVGFYHRYHCIVLGVQRRARMITGSMTGLPLAAGDVLLLMGASHDIEDLRESRDVLVMEWSSEDLPSRSHSLRTLLTFAGVVGMAALDIVPIHIMAFLGATAVILMNCINLRQAKRAVDAQIIMMVATGLALSIALERTGGAQFIAQHIIHAMDGVEPVFVMSALFALMAAMTNVLSNNATALIFTPIAINTANLLGVDPSMFIFAVIFASNCTSFATPIGYQTNLLVMGPGHYKFIDYVKCGLPLTIIVWITYTVFSYYYFQ